MAGVRQHFIPQFLQKGFTIDKTPIGFTATNHSNKKQRHQTWVFEKNGKSYKTSVSNKGAERFFYGSNDNGLDNVITQAEIKYSRLVKFLRTYQVNSLINDDILIPEFVVHILVRNKYLRISTQESGEVLLDTINSFFATPDDLKVFLLNDPNFQKTFNQKMKEKPEIVHEILKHNPNLYTHLIEKFVSLVHPIMISTFLDKKKDLSSISKNLHIKSLSESISPQERIEQIKRFNWFVIVNKPNSYILGDIVLFYMTKEGIYKPMLLEKTDIDNIVFPISHQHLLIGTSDIKHPIFETDLINSASASLSRDYFISSESTSREKKYLSDLGCKRSILSEYCSSELQDWLKRLT